MIDSRTNPASKRLFSTNSVIFTLIALFGLVGCGGSDNGDSTPSLSISSPTVLEGDSGTKEMVFTVTLSEAASSDLTADYATSDGTALAGTDYVASTGTITIAAGNLSETISITINGDTDIEVDETLSITLDNVQGISLAQSSYTSQGTITSDDHADPTGYYTGSATVKDPDNSTDLDIPDLQVLVNGMRIMAMGLSDDVDNFVLYDITLNNITGNSYTGDVTLYKAGEYLATTTVSGTISEGTSLEGSFAGAGIGNGSFSVSYDSVVNAKTAGLSEIAGTRYRGPVNASITDQRFDIDAAGNIISSFASTNAIKMAGCEYVAGSSLTAIAGQNLYDLVLVLSSCDDTTVDGSYTGLATLIDDPVLSLDNRYMPAAFSNGSFAGTASPFTLN